MNPMYLDQQVQQEVLQLKLQLRTALLLGDACEIKKLKKRWCCQKRELKI